MVTWQTNNASLDMLITVIISLCLWIQPQLSAANSNSNSNSTNNGETDDSCDRRCGNIDIPYPFGIGAASCYYNESFAITCNHSSSSDVPFLKTLDLEVIKVYSFSNDGGWSAGIILKNPLVTNNNNSQCKVCGDPDVDSSTGNNSHSATTCNNMMRKTPFCLSTYSILASKGCDGYGVLYDETDEFVAGCSSVLSPGGFYISVKGMSSTSPCRYALLIRDEYYSGDENNASTITAFPKILGWSIQDLRPCILKVLDWIIFAICIGPSIGILLFISAILWWCWR